MKFLASILSYETLDKNGELKEPDASAFDAAIAAIDRAAKERAENADRRAGEDRRKGSPDARPEGSPERRAGLERRVSQHQAFGKRNK